MRRSVEIKSAKERKAVQGVHFRNAVRETVCRGKL